METELSSNHLFSNILRNQISKILTTISTNYPKIFPKDNIDLELRFLMNNIVLEEVDYKLFEKKKQRNNDKTNINEIRKNTFIADNDESRCCARVWGNIYNKSTNEKIMTVDKMFNVENYKLLDVKKFNELYNIGTRCKKKIQKDSKYCSLHSVHLIHGDYFDIPNQELCHHFLKDNKFIC